MKCARSVGWLLLCLKLSFSAYADQTDDYIRDQMNSHRIPGLNLLVLQKGKEVKRQSYGLANVELRVPVTSESVFEIGSVSKQFASAAILLLAQQGKLSVDDPISRHLPLAPLTWSNVCIRHLLTHTSGIRSYTGMDGFELRKHLTQAAFIKLLSREPLQFQPGEGWKYSNSGFSLLGYIVENVSGRNYWDFLRENIFRPLQMRSTTDRNPMVIITNRVSGYEQTKHVWINRDYDLTDVFSAGAIVSTLDDLARWDAALDKNDLLSEATKKEMWTPMRLKTGKLTNYGFGWFIDQVEGHRNIGHSGSTSGFSASNQRFPDDDLVVIVLTNTDEQIATTLAKKIATFYFAR